MQFTTEIAGQTLTCTIVALGRDVSVALCGGQRAHIGCTVLALPRPSLTGTGRSATVSTLNRTGHKDDLVAAKVAELVAAELDCAVSCSCGIHVDNASPQLIEAFATCPSQIAQRICQLVRAQVPEYAPAPCPDATALAAAAPTECTPDATRPQ